MSDEAKCSCQVCNGHIAFPVEAAGQAVECPHCKMETVLFVPPPPPSPPTKPAPVKTEPPVTMPQAAKKPQGSGLFFYKIGNGEKGPYTLEQLRSLWLNGQITADAAYREEGDSIWLPLAGSKIVKTQNTNLALVGIHSLLLKVVFVLSLTAFFLPNASVSVPIFGKIEVSMFQFLTPKHDAPSATEEKTPKLNIHDAMDLDAKKLNAGIIICAVSGLGILLHYLLTIVWGVLTFAAKKSYSVFNTIWLSLALQFPVLFLIGAHIAVGAMKAEALKEAGGSAGDNSPGAELGNALGMAFINQISMQPGVIMWILMTVSLVVIGAHFISRKSVATN